MVELVDLHSSPEEIRRIQDRALKAMLRRCESEHPHYRGVLRSLGLDARDIASIDDLEKLPVTTKDDYVADPDAFVLQSSLSEPLEQLWDVSYTGGSTSTPAPVYQTGYDIQAILMAQLRMAEIRGMRSDERIANLYPFTEQAHGAWLRTNFAAAALGASLYVGMNGARTMFPVTRRLDEVLSGLVAFKPTVLWGVPSYLNHLAQNFLSRNLQLPSVTMLAVSGEPTTPEVAEELRDSYAAIGSTVSVSNSLGASELQCGLVECAPGTGFHNPAPELFHFAAVNDENRTVGDGEQGRLVLTHLDRRGTVLLRYLLGDVVTITDKPCPSCGRAGGRVSRHFGRQGTRIKVRGQLFDLNDLFEALARIPGLAKHQVRVRKSDPDSHASLDQLAIVYEDDDDVGASQRSRQIIDAVRKATGLTPVVERLSAGELFDPHGQFKPVNFVDERHRAHV